MIAALLVVGAHLATAHSQPGFEGVNPGLYVQAGAVSGGVYRNSHARTSVWAGYSVHSRRLDLGLVGVRAAGTVGAVTGYPRAAVMPMINASLAVDAGGPVAIRFTAIPNPLPKGAHALHVSIEVEL